MEQETKKQTEEERLQDMEKREQALKEKEEALKQEDRRHKAEKLLAENHLPSSLSQVLSLMEEEDMEESVSQWADMFRQAVQQAVEERLKENPPASGVMQDMSALPDSDYYAAKYPNLV